jgi:response regulator RpfG family c-di-GMP phosphodiesterase
MANKILFVDDDPSILDGYRRMLYREYVVETAVGGEEGLSTLREYGPYAVVISDMRMPEMSGAQFLAQALREAPDTVRMLLTGYTDLTAAMEAVNEGNIFRFLTKPCEKEVLVKAIEAGLAQHRLLNAEKELLERTLMGSIKVLTEVLSIASPEAFGRSLRVVRYVRAFMDRFDLPAMWQFEAAAMLSQMGCVTLTPELIQAAYLGEQMSAENRARFNAHPKTTRGLLAHIPRMESVAWMVSQQFADEALPGGKEEEAPIPEEIRFGAKMLRLALAFDDLKMQGVPDKQALATLRNRSAEFGQELLDALEQIKPESAKMELRKVPTSRLMAGMILQQELRTLTGILVVPKGQEITSALLIKLENYSRGGRIENEILALVPR